MLKAKGLRNVFAFAIIVFMMLVACTECRADELEIEYGVPTVKRVTCYLPTGNKTYSGTVPKPKYTIGGCKELIGCMVCFYKVKEDGSLGDFITMGMVEDTGSHGRIANGNSFDVFVEDMPSAKEWIKENGDYVYCVVINGEG